MGSWMFRGTPANAFWVALWLGTLACGVLLAASEGDSSKPTDPKEVQALLKFRNALDDPNRNLSSWTTTTDPCGSWKWIECDDEATPQDVDQNFRHVTSVNLLNLNLSGTLNASIGDLQALTILGLTWNRLSGNIPASIGQLQNLKLLLLSGNQFSGPLPAEIGNLGNLQRLQVDDNRFSGPIPSTFANLSSLVHMHMNNNTLTGTIPSGLGGLTDLDCGMPPIVDGKNLTREVNAAYREGDAGRIIDPKMGSYSMDTIAPLLKLALSCIDSETTRRPSMTDVLHGLEEIWREGPWSDVASQSHMEDDSRELTKGGISGGISGQITSPYSGFFDTSRSGIYNSGESELTSQTKLTILPR